MALIKARDLRDNIKTMGFERGVVHTLELLLEEFAAHRQYLQTLAENQASCIESLSRLTEVGGDLMRRLMEIRRAEQLYEQLKTESANANSSSRKEPK